MKQYLGRVKRYTKNILIKIYQYSKFESVIRYSSKAVE